jgi:hypothetical protein
MVHNDKGKAGFIDKEGKYVVQPELDGASHFVDGYALVRVKGENVYIDKTGKRIWSVTETADKPKSATKG